MDKSTNERMLANTLFNGQGFKVSFLVYVVQVCNIHIFLLSCATQ